MPQHSDLSRLTISQLMYVCRRKRDTIKRILQEKNVAPIAQVGNAIYYDAPVALHAIFGADDLNAEKAGLAREQREAQAMKNAISRGEQILIEDVSEWARDLFAVVPSRVLNTAQRAAPEVYDAESVEDAAQVIRKHLIEALQELAAASADPASTLAAHRGAA